MKPAKTKALAVGAAQGFGEQLADYPPDYADIGATLPISLTTDEPRMDSRMLAVALGIQHRNLIELVGTHRNDFSTLAKLRFETEALPTSRTGQRVKFALLTEDQCYLLLTYSRNTERVRQLKLRLVQTFREARNALDVRRREYLPGYHQLHDHVQALAGDSPNAKFVHINVNKLVNRAVGLDPGERHDAPLPKLAAIVLAQSLAARAMRGATDHHEGFAKAKTALHSLQGLLQLAGPEQHGA